jgi:hypothetical protein
MIHVNYHPDKFARMQSIWARYVEGDKHALDKYPVRTSVPCHYHSWLIAMRKDSHAMMHIINRQCVHTTTLCTVFFCQDLLPHDWGEYTFLVLLKSVTFLVVKSEFSQWPQWICMKAVRSVSNVMSLLLWLAGG